MNTNALSIRPSSARPSDLASLTLGELLCLVVADTDMDTTALADTIEEAAADDLELIDCACTDGVVLAEDLADAHRSRVHVRTAALTELARRLAAEEAPASGEVAA